MVSPLRSAASTVHFIQETLNVFQGPFRVFPMKEVPTAGMALNLHGG